MEQKRLEKQAHHVIAEKAQDSASPLSNNSRIASPSQQAKQPNNVSTSAHLQTAVVSDDENDGWSDPEPPKAAPKPAPVKNVADTHHTSQSVPAVAPALNKQPPPTTPKSIVVNDEDENWSDFEPEQAPAPKVQPKEPAPVQQENKAEKSSHDERPAPKSLKLGSKKVADKAVTAKEPQKPSEIGTDTAPVAVPAPVVAPKAESEPPAEIDLFADMEPEVKGRQEKSKVIAINPRPVATKKKDGPIIKLSVSVEPKQATKEPERPKSVDAPPPHPVSSAKLTATVIDTEDTDGWGDESIDIDEQADLAPTRSAAVVPEVEPDVQPAHEPAPKVAASGSEQQISSVTEEHAEGRGEADIDLTEARDVSAQIPSHADDVAQEAAPAHTPFQEPHRDHVQDASAATVTDDVDDWGEADIDLAEADEGSAPIDATQAAVPAQTSGQTSFQEPHMDAVKDAAAATGDIDDWGEGPALEESLPAGVNILTLQTPDTEVNDTELNPGEAKPQTQWTQEAEDGWDEDWE